MNLLTFSKLILTFLCLVLSINLSNASNKLGNNVNTLNKPNKTPLAITIPKSLPNVNCIVHSTKNPAIVVNELPITDLNVSTIASFIASSLFLLFFFLFSYE